jgi:hypothetical protein
MTRRYYQRNIDRGNVPDNFCPAEELLRAIVRQAALDVIAGETCKNKDNRQIKCKFHDYSVAKLWLQTNIDLFMFSAGITHRQAKTFLERH